ncbi:MAG: hypothetical protein WC807_17925 [Hyphomicrobium sp.]|jgi:hypothetical protein
MSVIEHDFGLKKRQAAQRFGSLLGLDALHEANIQANPLPYLERASERIYQLERALREAAEAALPPLDERPPAKIIEVDEADYRRLLNCRSIVEKALAGLGPDDHDL